MVELSLKTPLNGAETSLKGMSLREVVGGEICSISPSQDSVEDFDQLFRQQFQTDLPAPSRFNAYKDGIVLWTGPNQWFVSTSFEDAFLDNMLANSFGGVATVTLQTDAWARLEMTGSGVRSALERLFLIDTEDEVFTNGMVVRTLMGHVNVFLLRMNDSYQIWCARSFAKSVWAEVAHAIETTSMA